ncbi:MAG: hypothetical protein QXS20_06990 [Candidatus Thorarchaeota archaeon]
MVLQSRLDEGEQCDTQTSGLNPVTNYLITAVLTLIVYVIIFTLGWESGIVFLLVVTFQTSREARLVTARVTHSFPRAAAVFNAILALTFLSVIIINVYWFRHFGELLILPQVTALTTLSPMIILLSFMGVKNIRIIYCPVQQSTADGRQAEKGA